MRYSIFAIFLFSTLLHAEKVDQDILDIIAQDEEIIVHTEYEKSQDKSLGKLVTPKKTQIVKPIEQPKPVQQYSEQVITPLPMEEVVQEEPPRVQRRHIKKVAPPKIVKKSYKKESARRKMLRKAKYLKKKYEAAMIKFENWEAKKELLKDTFRKKNGNLDTEFGVGNSYGKKRAQKRRRDYYRSLDVQERHIQDRVDDAYVKLTQIKEDFLFQYAVPLTDSEMNGEIAPIIEDKSQKVEMLHEYINETNAWRKCREKASEFDRVNRVATSIEKLFPDSRLTQDTISQRMGQNKAEMQDHVNRYQNIELEYRTKYGVSISSSERAFAILENINKN